jgi:hypothetical protein
MRLREYRHDVGPGFCVRALLLLILILPASACDRRSESDQDTEGKTASQTSGDHADADNGGCEVTSDALPEDLRWVRSQLGEQFETETLPKNYAGCLLEPTGIHRSYVCANSQEVVADQEQADHFSLFVEVDGAVRSVISSTGATEEQLASAFECCEPFEAEPRFFGGDITEFHRCGDVEFAYGKPSQRMLRDDKFAVVMRHADFDLDEAVAKELGGKSVAVDALSYTLDNKEITDEVELLSGDTREAPEGQEFVTIYYTLGSDRPEQASISHDRIKVLDGGGKLFAPIPEARDDRSTERNGAPNAMMMLFQPGDSRQLKDVFLVPEGMLADGFGIRFFGIADDEYIDRYVLGERRWLERPPAEPSTESAMEADAATDEAGEGDASDDEE